MGLETMTNGLLEQRSTEWDNRPVADTWSFFHIYVAKNNEKENIYGNLYNHEFNNNNNTYTLLFNTSMNRHTSMVQLYIYILDE